ncbi:hypothetical protein [Moorena sp. SIO4G3]|uniref:hypothetical protein n=1 Tax=Moorena sp. SIO4G3 TaxID=2607821 RepID=UPI0014297AD0|nr:hypothetical protein [Moorena sp. SIO4G3]NEO78848.1 hypothetical protein [Moorena sp. SIO4G3]
MRRLSIQPSVVSRQWSAVSGQPSVVSRQWSAVSGQPSVVSRQWSAVSLFYSKAPIAHQLFA